ncbi:MAG: hypothetical protein ACLGH3_05550 [Actinomycetota bacterium]
MAVHCECGAVLVEEVTDRGVRPLDSEEAIVFRRTTDHVICGSCMTSFDVEGLHRLSTGEDQSRLRIILDDLD